MKWISKAKSQLYQAKKKLEYMLKILVTQVKSQQTPVMLSSYFYQSVIFAYIFTENSS